MIELIDALAVALKAALGFQAVFFALLAIGLNVQFGYAGLLKFGQIAFAMLGGFGIAISVSQWGLPFWVGVLIAIGAAVVLALLLGLPTLRLRADYLAIVTIATAEGIRLVFRSVSATPVTGGTRGLSAFNGDFIALAPWDTQRRYDILGTAWSGAELWVALVGWILVAVSSLLVWQLMRSPWGRVVKAIREDEDAVRSLGKNVYAYKMQSLILGGVIGAVGGMFWVIAQAAIVPGSFSPIPTFYAYAALILGGLARVWGPVVGSMIFWALLSLSQGVINEVVANEYIPNSIMDANQAGNVRFMLVGLGLILLLVFRPQDR